MECNNCNRRTSNCSCNNRNMNNREMCSERSVCGGRGTGGNISRNMNCNMNRNIGRNIECEKNRNMGCNAGCGMNRCMRGNMNRNMNRNMERKPGCVMDRKEDCVRDCDVCRNDKNNMGCDCKHEKDECAGGCDRGNEPVDRMNPGMSFVPWQEWRDIYDMDKGLERGTIFEELDKPYLGRPLK